MQDGLIGTFEGWWVFLDWQTLHRGNYSAVLNMMYLQALRYGAAICELAGDAKSAGTYSTRAQALTTTIGKYFWNETTKQWRDGFDAATKEPVEEVSQHANTLAMLLGLKREHRAKIAREVLIKSANARKGKVLTASPFFYAYVLEALAEAGFRGEVVQIIRDKWG